MFQPPIFREERVDVLQQMIQAHPFATLITVQQGQIVADHIPLLIDPNLSTQGTQGSLGTLRGHIARGNPIARKLDQTIELLVTFNGPHHYITPSWYQSKKEHGKVVPTYNYIVVHARGKIKLHQDSNWLLEHLNELTNRHEKGRQDPWAISDAPEDFIANQLRGITGIEIEITSLQGTWKVSQNKTAADNNGVCSGLKSQSGQAAHAMAVCVDARQNKQG